MMILFSPASISSKCSSLRFLTQRAMNTSLSTNASGVSAIDSVTTMTSEPVSVGPRMPLLPASPNSTKANSPPWQSATARPREESQLWPDMRPSPSKMAALTPISPSAAPKMASGCASTSPRLADIPTEMKNKPNSNPLNGSMSASSSCRYSESASSTPARNAPSDMDNPTDVISSDVPMTTSNAAAVNISWMPAAEMTCSTGRNR